MRVSKYLAFAAIAFSWGTAAQAQWPATTNPGNGGFWAEANGMALDRPGSDIGITLINDSVTLAPVFTSNQLTDMNGAGGVQFRFGNQNHCFGMWEFCGSTAKWDSEFDFIGANLESPFFPGFSPDQVGFLYDSQFYNLEFNFRRAVAPGCTFLYGPRYFNLQEDMTFISLTDFQGNLLVTGDTISTRNSAIGGQCGLEMNMPLLQTVYVQGFIKVAGLNDSTTVDTTSGSTITQTTSTRAHKDTGMFIGQTGGRVYCEWFPRTLATYAGYEATWVDGVALAPPQFFSTGTQTVFTANTFFWHAITFGVRFQY